MEGKHSVQVKRAIDYGTLIELVLIRKIGQGLASIARKGKLGDQAVNGWGKRKDS